MHACMVLHHRNPRSIGCFCSCQTGGSQPRWQIDDTRNWWLLYRWAGHGRRLWWIYLNVVRLSYRHVYWWIIRRWQHRFGGTRYQPSAPSYFSTFFVSPVLCVKTERPFFLLAIVSFRLIYRAFHSFFCKNFSCFCVCCSNNPAWAPLDNRGWWRKNRGVASIDFLFNPRIKRYLNTKHKKIVIE